MPQPFELLKEVINTQYFAVLTTVDKGLPYSNLISFAVIDDMRFMVFVTKRNTRKYENIQADRNISLLIDNRTNQPSDVSKALAITVIGTAREEIKNKSSLKEMFLARHPQLKQFVDASNNAIMLVTVQEYIMAGFDKTTRVVMTL
jgi:uncharacterized pyridoxamine 5'-phosphate oxidase family protein